MTDPPRTTEGWYSLHDFRRVKWDGWRAAPDRRREDAIAEGREHLSRCELVADAEEGASAVFSTVGHKADLMFVHFRPTLDALSALERRFESTALAAFTERTTSYVSVTEVSDYVSDAYFDGAAEGDVDEGLERYIEGKLKPAIPEGSYASFYPMDRRREPGANWYELPYDERAEMMAEHGRTGREHAREISQVIASSLGFDDHEWGVTLFASDPAALKDVVYEMRFDEASATYSDFGSFYVGRRFPPEDLGAFLAGEPVPTGDRPGEAGRSEGEDGARMAADGSPGTVKNEEGRTRVAGGDGDGIRGELADLNVYAGQPTGEDVYATVLYSETDVEELFGAVEGLRGNFDHYDTHVKTAVYEAEGRDRAAVVSVWETASAAETAAGFLSDLPGVVGRADEESGFGTMGMFYTVKPDRREDFLERFETVEGVLGETEGHLETDLMVNREDENDMFIASQWRSKENAMEFFRSAEFRDTVEWGREVLADRPRHVFLA